MVNDKDIVAARNTFHGFVTLMKVGAIASVIAGLIIILLIAPK